MAIAFLLLSHKTLSLKRQTETRQQSLGGGLQQSKANQQGEVR